MRDLHCPTFRGGVGGLKDVHHLVAHVCSRLLSLDVCHFQPPFLPAAKKIPFSAERDIFHRTVSRRGFSYWVPLSTLPRDQPVSVILSLPTVGQYTKQFSTCRRCKTLSNHHQLI